jgi:hypothetical protein
MKFLQEFQSGNIFPIYYNTKRLLNVKVHSIQTAILKLRVENKYPHRHKKVNNANLFAILTTPESFNQF